MLQPNRWLIAAVITAVLTWVLPPSIIETVYSRGLFLGIRWATSQTMGLLPFAWYYLFWVAIVGVIYRWIPALRQYSRRARWRKIGSGLLTFISCLYLCFQWLWGFNYGRVKFEKQANLKADSIGISELRQEVDTQMVRLIQAHTDWNNTGYAKTTLPPNLEDTMRRLLTQTMRQFGYPIAGDARVRGLQPKGVLMRFSSSGVYWPFVAEANFDTGLHPLQWPFVMAHELGHAYGITDEGVCNFLAWVACQHSNQPIIRYAGEICYWREVGANYKYADKEAYLALRATLPQGITTDLDDMNQNLADYPDFVSLTGVYDLYLKWQGVPEGLTNYSKIIRLVRAYRQKNEQHIN